MLFVGNSQSIAAKTMDLLQIPEIMYELKDSILYMPNAVKMSPLLHFFPRLTWSFVQTITGFNSELHVDLSAMPMMAANDVGGTSTKNMLHWIQMIRTKRFRAFDYGSQKNQHMYG